MDKVYACISKETLTAAKDRALQELNAITDGQAELAIGYVKEILEIESILEQN